MNFLASCFQVSWGQGSVIAGHNWTSSPLTALQPDTISRPFCCGYLEVCVKRGLQFQRDGKEFTRRPDCIKESLSAVEPIFFTLCGSLPSPKLRSALFHVGPNGSGCSPASFVLHQPPVTVSMCYVVRRLTPGQQGNAHSPLLALLGVFVYWFTSNMMSMKF